MIIRLHEKQLLDCYNFIKDSKSIDEFYITLNGKRVNLDNLKILKSLLRNQEIYGIYDRRLLGLMLIYREKGFRPYIKLLAENNKQYNNLMIYFRWNMSGEFYLKIKKNSLMVKVANYYKWQFKGLRDNDELLFFTNNIVRKNNDNYYNKD